MDNDKDFKKAIRDSSTNIQSSATTFLNQLEQLIDQLNRLTKKNIEGLDTFLNFSKEIKENSAKFAALDFSGVITSYSEVISSVARELDEISGDLKKNAQAKELRNILKHKIQTFYASFFDNLEYLTEKVKEQVVSAKIDQIVEDANKSITNPFIKLAQHGFKFKKAAEYVQSGIVGLEPGKSFGWGQSIARGTTLALGQFGDKLLKLTGVLDLVSGVFTKITVVSGAITFAVQEIINFLNYQRQLQASLGTIGTFNLTPLSKVATEFEKGFDKAIGGAFAGVGAGISKIQDEVAKFLGSTPRLFNIPFDFIKNTSHEFIENVSAAFTKAAIFGKAFGMSFEESMRNLMNFYSVIGLSRGKLYDIYKTFVVLAAKANLSFSELDEIIGSIPKKIMLYGTESVKNFGAMLTSIVSSFKNNIELGRAIASGISNYLNKSLVYQVGMVAAYGDLSRVQDNFIDESYSSLGKFLTIVKNNLGESVLGTLATASALGQFFDETVERAYFTNKEAREKIDNLIKSGFKDKQNLEQVIKEIKSKTYEERSLEILKKQQDLLQYIIQIIEDIKRGVYRLVSIFTGNIFDKFRAIKMVLSGSNNNTK
jgi:polyhydroxyalkanoate synthesis regulator phasin